MDLRALRDRVESLKKAGVRGAELLYVHSAGERWEVHRGRAQRLDRPDQESVSVRLWTDEGRGGSRTGPPAELDTLVDGALADAARSAPDPYAGPVSRLNTPLGGLGILDRRHDTITASDREELLISAEKSVKSVDRRLTPSGFSCADRLRRRRFVNSRGVALEEADTQYSAAATVSVQQGGREFALSTRIESRTFASIASIPFGTILAGRVAALLGPPHELRGPVRVVLPPLAVASLIAALAERFSAELLSEDGSFLRPRADGRAVVDPRLHLQDDGAMPGGLRTGSFDDRGVASVPLTLLREGRVDGRFVSPEAAHRLDARPTGHTRGATQQPSNLILRSGTRSMSAALIDLGGSSLQVDDLPGLPHGLDFATGQLRVRVHGVVLEGNRPAGVVRDRLLTGDLGVALNRVVEVCSDTDRIGHVDVPGLILDGLTLE